MKKFKELMIMILLVPTLTLECALKAFVVAHNAIQKLNDKLMLIAVKDNLQSESEEKIE